MRGCGACLRPIVCVCVCVRVFVCGRMFARVCTYCRHRVQLASVQKICLSRVQYHVAYTFVCMYLPDIHECLHMYTRSLSLSLSLSHTHTRVSGTTTLTRKSTHSTAKALGAATWALTVFVVSSRFAGRASDQPCLGAWVLGCLGVCMPLSICLCCLHTIRSTRTHTHTHTDAPMQQSVPMA